MQYIGAIKRFVLKFFKIAIQSKFHCYHSNTPITRKLAREFLTRSRFLLLLEEFTHFDNFKRDFSLSYHSGFLKSFCEYCPIYIQHLLCVLKIFLKNWHLTLTFSWPKCIHEVLQILSRWRKKLKGILKYNLAKTILKLNLKLWYNEVKSITKRYMYQSLVIKEPKKV